MQGQYGFRWHAVEKTSDEIHELTLAGWEIQDVSITPIATLTVDVNRGVIDVVSRVLVPRAPPSPSASGSSRTMTRLNVGLESLLKGLERKQGGRGAIALPM